MLDDQIRRRLEQLNRRRLPTQAVPSDAAALRPNRTATTRPGGAVTPIAGMLDRGETVTTDAGRHVRIGIDLEELWPAGPEWIAGRHARVLRLAEDTLPGAEFAALVGAFPERVLFLDLETCGLAGAALFLIGLLRMTRGKLAVELLFARNYAEEQAVLQTFWQTAQSHEVLVTFNGKSFDWPMVCDRSRRFHMMPANSAHANGVTPSEFLHVDLLHHARRRWRRQLPDCRLQTLERYVCRRGRIGDIPGQQIPAAYAEFVRTGQQRDIDAILYHNAVDLVTMLDLAMRLAA